MILFVILLTTGLIATASAQSCSVATSGSLNGLCPTGYTLIPSGCCPSDCVVTATTASTCFDKLNPDTGKSDCPGMKGYCTNSAYLSLMKEQCPLTCGYCTGKFDPFTCLFWVVKSTLKWLGPSAW
ncbi:shTK domain protein [Cooperia oncophora]